MKRYQLITLSLLALGTLAHSLYFFDRLPNRVAVHFDIAVQPDNWAGKGSAMALYIGVVFVMTLLFVLLPVLIARTPRHLVNIPNRDYWLAPERRDASLGYIGSMLGWIGITTSVMLMGIFHLLFEANLREPVAMNGWAIAGLIVGDLVVLAVLMLFMTRRFKLPGTV